MGYKKESNIREKEIEGFLYSKRTDFVVLLKFGT